jgi:hypothetical protein
MLFSYTDAMYMIHFLSFSFPLPPPCSPLRQTHCYNHVTAGVLCRPRAGWSQRAYSSIGKCSDGEGRQWWELPILSMASDNAGTYEISDYDPFEKMKKLRIQEGK